MDQELIQKLGNAVAAKNANEAFMATEAEMKPLIEDDLVEFNKKVKEGDKIAFRATDKGVDTYQDLNGASNPQNTSGIELSSEASQYEIEDNVPVPEGRRRTGPKMKYPFDRLEVGQSFFVAATEDKPNPAKSLASTVSTAMRRYSVKDGTRINRNGETVDNYKPTRVFRVEPAEKDGKKGARIWRTA